LRADVNVLTNTNGCGLCRENEIKFYKAIPQLDRKIVQCRNCGLVFVHPMNGTFVTLDFEALEEREEKYHRMNVEAEREGKHDEDMINEEEETRTLHFNRRKKTIERYVNTGKLLDIGCGRGFFLSNFVDSPFDYVGVEPRRRISNEAEKRVGEDKIICGTLKEAKLPDATFDVVTMINLVEHLSSPRETLEEVNRIMKHNGLVYIETPNLDSLVPKILGKRWHAYLEREHHYFFSKKTLAKMLGATGFRVERTGMGNKLFSIRYLLYRLSWYNARMSLHLERIFEGFRLLDRAVKIPQPDELVFIARKTMDVAGLTANEQPMTADSTGQ
jgi:2-polyprenyl-3-methyl-5-hydroxy-6-metoxy-1,4-benzoquinol methylase